MTDSSSHKTRSVLLFCGPAHTDSLWPVLTRVKSAQAQLDVGQNGPGSQVGLEHHHPADRLWPVKVRVSWILLKMIMKHFKRL